MGHFQADQEFKIVEIMRFLKMTGVKKFLLRRDMPFTITQLEEIWIAYFIALLSFRLSGVDFWLFCSSSRLTGVSNSPI